MACISKQVNARQEKALQSMDKEQDDFPKVFKTMNEELRIARVRGLEYNYRSRDTRLLRRSWR
jgi:hypothetical protein